MIATRSRSSSERSAVVSLTKYGFPRRRMLLAARFRQWHFNRTPKSSKLSCLHLHRVFFSLLPFPPPARGFALREFTCRAATQSAANAHRMPREVWLQMRAELLSRIEPQAFAPYSSHIRKSASV